MTVETTRENTLTRYRGGSLDYVLLSLLSSYLKTDEGRARFGSYHWSLAFSLRQTSVAIATTTAIHQALKVRDWPQHCLTRPRFGDCCMMYHPSFILIIIIIARDLMRACGQGGDWRAYSAGGRASFLA